MTIKLTVSPHVKQRLQRNQNHSGYTEQLSFYVRPEFAAKINQIATTNKRSISSVLSEMVEFALDRLNDGDAELEGSASDPKEQQRSSKPKVTLRVTNAHEPTYAEIAAETLKRIPGPSDEFYDEAHRRNASARNGYKDHVLE